MHIVYGMYRLHLDNDAALHKEVDPVGAVHAHPIVDDRGCHLRVDFQAGLLEFMSQARVVDPLEEAIPQGRVDAVGSFQNLASQLVDAPCNVLAAHR